MPELDGLTMLPWIVVYYRDGEADCRAEPLTGHRSQQRTVVGGYGEMLPTGCPWPKDLHHRKAVQAYSRMATPMSIIPELACASTREAFCALYREMSSRKPSDTAAASKAMSAVRGLNTNRHQERHRPCCQQWTNRFAHASPLVSRHRQKG